MYFFKTDLYQSSTLIYVLFKRLEVIIITLQIRDHQVTTSIFVKRLGIFFGFVGI